MKLAITTMISPFLATLLFAGHKVAGQKGTKKLSLRSSVGGGRSTPKTLLFGGLFDSNGQLGTTLATDVSSSTEYYVSTTTDPSTCVPKPASNGCNCGTSHAFVMSNTAGTTAYLQCVQLWADTSIFTITINMIDNGKLTFDVRPSSTDSIEIVDSSNTSWIVLDTKQQDFSTSSSTESALTLSSVSSFQVVITIGEDGRWKASNDVVPVPTKVPVKPPTSAPVKPPTSAPVKPPTSAPVKPPTSAPVKPPTSAPVKPPTSAPVKPPTSAPVKPPTSAPVKPPTSAPVKPPTSAPVKPPTSAPVKPPTSAPVMQLPTPPTPDPLDSFSLIISSDPQYPWYDNINPVGLNDIEECSATKNNTCRGSGHYCLDAKPKQGCNAPGCPNTCSEPSSFRDENPIKRNSERMIRQQYNSMIDLKSKRNVQGVIINGDLTNLGKDWHWSKAQELIKILSSASLRVFPSLGNHDYDVTRNLNWNGALPDATRMVNAMTDWLNNQWNSNSEVVLSKAPMVNEATKFCGSMAYSFNIGKVHILQLQFYPSFTASQQPPCDTKLTPQCQPTTPTDWIVDGKKYSITDSWGFMESDLATARNEGKIILVFLHDYGSDNLQTGVQPSKTDTDKFEQMLTQYKVSAVFAGHIHQSYGKIDKGSNGLDYAYPVPFFRSGAASQQVYLVADIDVPRRKMKIWLSEDTKSLNTTITDETVRLIDENAALFPSGQYNSEPLANKFWDVDLIDTKPTTPEIVPVLPGLSC